MDAPSDRHMRSSEIRAPHSVADGLAARAWGKRSCLGSRAYMESEGWSSYLDIARVDRSASNMAERALSRLWRWRPDPPPCAGLKSFSPRFGMTGRAALPLPRLGAEG